MSLTTPRILVQSGCYDLDNLGDQSMLEAAIARVHTRIPGAKFTVLSRSEKGLREIAPYARPLSVENRTEWKWVRSAYIGLRNALPDVDPFIRDNFPEFFSSLLRFKARRLVNDSALAETDFLLLSGGGYFTDVFAGQAWSSLERLKVAHARGIPFAIMGHGIGPLHSDKLVRAVRDMLRRAKLICVRESLRSLPILESYGIDPDRIVATGDDSVEHGWSRRKERIGDSLGVNLRVAHYAGTLESDIAVMNKALQMIASAIDPAIISVPVCVARSVEALSDADVDSRIISGLKNASDNGPPRSVEESIERTSMCRVVVTGSYHGAVFALSQGIPAVCIYASEYYRAKFEGLAGQFGAGCIVVARRSNDFQELVRQSVIVLWSDAERLRPHLIQAAANQIGRGHRAYDRLAAIITDDRNADQSSPELVA